MRRLALVAAAALLGAPLTACSSSDPTAQVRDQVAAVTAAGNARDAVGLRGEVADLLALLDQQQRSGDLTPEQAARLAAAAREVEGSAALVDQDAIDAEQREREEAEQRAREEAEQRAREAAERREREEAARQAAEQEAAEKEAEQEAQARDEAARKAAEEEQKAAEQARKAAEDADKGKDDERGSGGGDDEG